MLYNTFNTIQYYKVLYSLVREDSNYTDAAQLTILEQIALNMPIVSIPTVSTSASSYGAFLGLSGNLRYQLVNGAERLMQDQHLGVVIFFSTALRYLMFLATSECVILNGFLVVGDDTNFLSPVFGGNQPCFR